MKTFQEFIKEADTWNPNTDGRPLRLKLNTTTVKSQNKTKVDDDKFKKFRERVKRGKKLLVRK